MHSEYRFPLFGGINPNSAAFFDEITAQRDEHSIPTLFFRKGRHRNCTRQIE
jgi:hypothetical protein